MKVIRSLEPSQPRIANGCLSPVWSMGWRMCRHCSVCQELDAWSWENRFRIEALGTKTFFATWTLRPRGKHWVPTRDNTWPDIQKALKRMRSNGHDFRYFCAPEFGDTKGRHHYHLLFHGNGLTARAVRNHWKQGYTHARVARQGDGSYIGKYAAKQPGRKCASLRYGLPDKAVLPANPMISEIFKCFAKAEIRAIGKTKLPYAQRKKLTKELRSTQPYKPIPPVALQRIDRMERDASLSQNEKRPTKNEKLS